MERTIVLKKKIAAMYGNKKQIIGSGYINRHKGGKECHCSPDCMWVEPMLKGLKYKENEVDIDMTISLDEFEGSVPMWVFCKLVKSRMLCSGRKPEFVKMDDESETWRHEGSAIYLDQWVSHSYFEEIKNVPFQVYVSVKRSEQ